MGAQAFAQLTPVAVQQPIGTKRIPIVNDMWLIVKKITKVVQNATYSSVWVESRHFGRVTGTCLFDRTGSLQIEQSNDGFTVDYTTTIATTLSVIDAFSIELVCPFVRITWVNGNVGDTAVHKLYAYLKVV